MYSYHLTGAGHSDIHKKDITVLLRPAFTHGASGHAGDAEFDLLSHSTGPWGAV